MIWPWVVLAARVDSSTRQKTKMNICLNSLYGNYMVARVGKSQVFTERS